LILGKLEAAADIRADARGGGVPLTGHRFNDDLFNSEEARERAAREHSHLFHVLDHEALRREFITPDRAANRQKRISFCAGSWALVCALASLIGGASEPLWGPLNPWRTWLSCAFAGLGLAAFAVAGVGVIHGRRKLQWLTNRLRTDRLRQFHFQTFVSRLPTIVDSMASDRAKKTYCEHRGIWFESFLVDMKKERFASVGSVTAPDTIPLIWLHSSSGEAPEWPPSLAGRDLQFVFHAYDVFRFQEQEGYAEYILRERNATAADDGTASSQKRAGSPRWPWFPGMNLPIRARRDFLRGLAWASLGILTVLHASVLIEAAWSPEKMGDSPLPVAILVCALVAVASKTLGEGMALTREVERHEEYRAVVRDLRRRFLGSNDPQMKFRMMVRMEEASFEEMRTFLRAHLEARFIL